LNILIIDDIDAAREILIELLKIKFPTIVFYQSSNILETLEITNRVNFDLIILDLQLEDSDYKTDCEISGLRLLRKLKKTKKNVVILTAMFNNYYFTECTKLGTKYIQKNNYKNLLEELSNIIKEVA